MSLRPTIGTLSEDSPRAAAWREIFGGLEVPLISPVPVRADSPAGVKTFYRVDVRRLDPPTLTRLIRHVVSAFGESPAEVERTLHDPEHGLPILAEDVRVAFDARLVL